MENQIYSATQSTTPIDFDYEEMSIFNNFIDDLQPSNDNNNNNYNYSNNIFHSSIFEYQSQGFNLFPSLYNISQFEEEDNNFFSQNNVIPKSHHQLNMNDNLEKSQSEFSFLTGLQLESFDNFDHNQKIGLDQIQTCPSLQQSSISSSEDDPQSPVQTKKNKKDKKQKSSKKDENSQKLPQKDSRNMINSLLHQLQKKFANTSIINFEKRKDKKSFSLSDFISSFLKCKDIGEARKQFICYFQFEYPLTFHKSKNIQNSSIYPKYIEAFCNLIDYFCENHPSDNQKNKTYSLENFLSQFEK